MIDIVVEVLNQNHVWFYSLNQHLYIFDKLEQFRFNKSFKNLKVTLCLK